MTIETAGVGSAVAVDGFGVGQTRHCARPGGRIGYDVSGEGPLIVCVPGMGDLRSVYAGVLPGLLAAGFRVATMDLRGHGDSDATFDSYDDVAAGGDILALVRELGGSAVVIGNSMGAGAAVWAAAEDPEAVRGLVLVGPFVRDAPVGRVKELLFRVALAGPWGRAAWGAWLAQLYPGRRGPTFEAHRASVRTSLSRPGHWAALQATARTSHAPIAARLGEVRAPALVVMGERDPDFGDPRAEADWIAGRLNAEVTIVAGAGHYPQAEYPEVVVPAVLGFLERVVHDA